jgi:hypothetical protein
MGVMPDRFPTIQPGCAAPLPSTRLAMAKAWSILVLLLLLCAEPINPAIFEGEPPLVVTVLEA